MTVCNTITGIDVLGWRTYRPVLNVFLWVHHATFLPRCAHYVHYNILLIRSLLTFNIVHQMFLFLHSFQSWHQCKVRRQLLKIQLNLPIFTWKNSRLARLHEILRLYPSSILWILKQCMKVGLGTITLVSLHFLRFYVLLKLCEAMTSCHCSWSPKTKPRVSTCDKGRERNLSYLSFFGSN